MRIRVETVEVQTLHSDGRHWDSPRCAPIAKQDLGAFFALSLSEQCERLAELGDTADPPHVSVVLIVDEHRILETSVQRHFACTWSEPMPAFDLAPGTQLRVDVEDLDRALRDRIGTTTVPVPQPPPDGRWILGPFGQVRRLVLRCE
jgi:hypothetical protein